MAGEVGQCGGEVEPPGVGEADRQAAVCLEAVAGSPSLPKLGRGGAKDFGKGTVELTDAAKAGGGSAPGGWVRCTWPSTCS